MEAHAQKVQADAKVQHEENLKNMREQRDQADMLYFPDRDLTIVLSANASLGKTDCIYAGLVTAVVQMSLDAAR